MAPPALNLVRDAIELDNQKQTLPALIKYTEALVAIGGSLLETYKSIEAESAFSSDSSAKKFLDVLNQCVDRINALFGTFGQSGEESLSHSGDIDDKIDVRQVYDSATESGSDDFHARCSITDSQSSVDRYSTVTEDPIADAKEQNQRLLSAHVEKLKRGNLTASTQATLNMALQRQMSENLELARQRKRESEAKKESTRQAALDALQKNRETASLSHEEKQFIADVKMFEEDCVDLRLYSFELNKREKSQATSPEFQTILDHYMDTILSIPDHPYCNYMRQMRHSRVHYLKNMKSDMRSNGLIRTMVEDDVHLLAGYFVHSLLLKKELKPKPSVVMDRVNEAYVSGLVPVMVDLYRDVYSQQIKAFKAKIQRDNAKQLFTTSSSPTMITDAAKTFRSLNNALTPKAMLNILVSTCKAVSCRQLEPGGENEKLNSDDLICTLAAIIVEARSSDIIVWAAIMEEFIDSFGDGQLSIGEEGFCLTSLHAAIQRRMDDQDPSTKANVSPEKAEADFRRRFQHARQDLVRQLIIRHFKAKTKINSDAQKMMTELVRLFVLEACGRAAEQACEYQGVTDVTPEHLQQILPQLLFDFT